MAVKKKRKNSKTKFSIEIDCSVLDKKTFKKVLERCPKPSSKNLKKQKITYKGK